MKKFAYFCIGLTVVSILFLIGWDIYSSTKGGTVSSYYRFHTDDGKVTSFNWAGLISPKQLESQKIINDTIRFTARVLYPYGKGFKLIEPKNGHQSEKVVADEIERIINDSISRITINSKMNYDGTSIQVRNYAKPETLPLVKPTATVDLMGTASPEATKYGFEKSIQVNHFEKENEELAKARLDRTAKYLEQSGIKVRSKHSLELQFYDKAEVNQAIKNKSVLNSMRFVVADVTIPIQKLEVTTITAPMLLPIWFMGLVLGLVSLWKLRSLPNLRLRKFKSRKKWSMSNIIEKMKNIILSISVCILLILFFSILFFLFGTFILVLIISIFVFYLLWIFRKRIGPFLYSVLEIIYLFFVMLWHAFLYPLRWVLIKGTHAIHWWSHLMPCRKVLFFVTLYAIAITALALYLYFTCPCW